MQLSSLIRQGLDLDRGGDDEETILRYSRVELVSFARSVLGVYADEKRRREKQLVYEFHAGSEYIYVRWDAVKLESVLDNLLSNAVKYTPQGGKVVLSLSLAASGIDVEVSVSDTGIGIPLKEQTYVFRRFFQASNVVGRKDGSGVGLYLVKNYTELHGGSIRLVSKENEGTTVTLTLPMDEVQPSHDAPKVLVGAPTPIRLQEVEVASYDEKLHGKRNSLDRRTPVGFRIER